MTKDKEPVVEEPERSDEELEEDVRTAMSEAEVERLTEAEIRALKEDD